MAMRKPAAKETATPDQAKRDELELKKETLKDLTRGDAQIKGGVRKTADPDDGGE